MESLSRDHSAKLEAMAHNTIIFLLAFLWFIELNIIGRLFFIELVYIVIAGLIILTPGRLSISPFMKKVLVLLGISLLALILTDWYRGTAFQDYSRGWSKIFFLGINVFVIYHLCQNNRQRLFIFLFGLAVGGLVKPSFFPEPNFVAGGFWKTGYGIPATTLGFLAAYSFGINGVGVAFGLALLNLGLGFRSLALSCLAATLVPILSQTRYFKLLKNPGTILRNALAVILIVGGFTYWYYNIGTFDPGTIAMGQYKLEEAEKNPLYGRLEFLVGLVAVWDSPIVGRGSWAKDPKYATMLEQMFEKVGREDFYGEGLFETLIPSHSYLIGSWVEAGICGALFWFFLLFQSLKGMVYLRNFKIELVASLAFFLSWFIWNILFTPLGAGERLTAAFFIVLLNWVLTQPQGLANGGIESPKPVNS